MKLNQFQIIKIIHHQQDTKHQQIQIIIIQKIKHQFKHIKVIGLIIHNNIELTAFLYLTDYLMIYVVFWIVLSLNVLYCVVHSFVFQYNWFREKKSIWYISNINHIIFWGCSNFTSTIMVSTKSLIFVVKSCIIIINIFENITNLNEKYCLSYFMEWWNLLSI